MILLVLWFYVSIKTLLLLRFSSLARLRDNIRTLRNHPLIDIIRYSCAQIVLTCMHKFWWRLGLNDLHRGNRIITAGEVPLPGVQEG